MTSPVTPPAAPSVPPYPALGSPSFNAEAYTYATTMPAVVDGIEALAANAFTNATAAKENGDAAVSSAASVNAAAATATTKAAEASASAVAAATSATNASTSAIAASKLNLGDKPSPPSTDNQGAALRPGATYFDTTLNKWRVWTGSAWVDGISAVAGVSSLNGQTGDLTLNKSSIGLANVDNTADSAKAVLSASKLTTARKINGVGFDGTAAINIPGNPAVIPATGGVMDCALGDHFTLTISGNTTLSFANIPAGAYACILEVSRTAGTLTFPSGTVWSGIAPTLTVGRHLFYFERAQLGTAGWYASSLTGYAA